MKRYIFIILALLTCVATSYADQNEPDGKKNIHFTYDVDFEMNFDNREYYKSAFSESMTIFGARLTPSVGLEAVQSDGTSHRVMIGADIMKDFGAPPQVKNCIAGRGHFLLFSQQEIRQDTDAPLCRNLSAQDNGGKIFRGILL